MEVGCGGSPPNEILDQAGRASRANRVQVEFVFLSNLIRGQQLAANFIPFLISMRWRMQSSPSKATSGSVVYLHTYAITFFSTIWGRHLISVQHWTSRSYRLCFSCS